MDYHTVPIDLKIAVLKQVAFKWVQLNIPGAGITESIAMQRAALQGMINSPDIFNLIIDMVMDMLHERWDMLELGILLSDKVDDNHCVIGERLTHQVWADNFYLYAENELDGNIMLQDITTCLEDLGMNLKPSSCKSSAWAISKARRSHYPQTALMLMWNR